MKNERLLGAAAGVVSAGLGLGLSTLASSWLQQRASPIVAVSESILRLTPGAVDEAVISVAGHNDKPLLLGLTLLGTAVLSAVVGVLAVRSLLAAQAAFVAFGVVVGLAVHARLSGSQSTYFPAVIGTVAGLVALTVLVRRLADADVDEPGLETAYAVAGGGGRTSSRRQFLVWGSGVAVLAVAAGVGGTVLGRGRAAVEAARRGLRLPVRSRPAPPGVRVGVPGVSPWVTSQTRLYRVDTTLAVPQILPADWRLRVHGMVGRPLELSYQDLLDRGLDDAWITLCCVSNPVGGPLIGNALWSGVRLADVLADARPHPSADAVKSTSADGWTSGTPLRALTDGRNAMLALAANGQPLTPEHGFPVRMIVPGLYGYVSATKWVVDLEVTQFGNFSAFWTERGWSPLGPVKTESRIDVPRNGDTLHAGQVPIAGVAWAQHRGIAKVEVRIGSGPWQVARLAADPTIDSWRQWVLQWDATPGTHEIQVRATDDTGYTQTGQLADVIPDGATGWHSIEVQVA